MTEKSLDVFRLEQLLGKLPDIKIAVFGDFCLDVYWTMDDSAAEKSVETGLPTRPIREQRYSLGGAGNVVSNLLSLGVGEVKAMGVTGDDPFGREMRRLLDIYGAGCDGMLVQEQEWDTPTYIKPVRNGEEQNRLDLGNYNRLQETTATRLIEHLRNQLDELDGVIINQQLLSGVHTCQVQDLLREVLKAYSEQTFIVDARKLAAVYANAVLKVNAVEATTMCGAEHQPGDLIALDEARDAALQLYQDRGKPVYVSRGPRGCLVADETGPYTVPGLHIVSGVDPVGAGDSMTAGIAASLAAGADPQEAAIFGNLVAGVTVQKLFETGTASPEEIREIGSNPDYIYEPELANDPRRARYIDGTEIECIDTPPTFSKITHAIFDHDGTISTLRQGWEEVMKPMMTKAILGKKYQTADETLYDRVVSRVREYIDATTGIETLLQMRGLVNLIREFGIVDGSEVLDEYRYKEIYIEALMQRVNRRLDKLQRGELEVSDLTVKNAPDFLKRLHSEGVKLYLASGTDDADVIAEAEALGYAQLFENRIYGAVGSVQAETKKMVLDRILADIDQTDQAGLAAFGDGPVEIRETRKRGGLAIGIASDEVRRYGLDPAKRSRLIRAGAHIVVPDFSQGSRLFSEVMQPGSRPTGEN
ncbi:MAG: HAD family hydrolase [Planctomycetes bacterium]|nr:HAD family hydrolase [Planctomycetota bacterium]